jgi:nitrogen fixation-related uncharacterized protein
VVYEARSGGLDDLDAPAERAALDDDSVPEQPRSLAWREVRDLSP